MKVPERPDYILFGGTFVLANKLQFVSDRMVSGLSTKQWFLLRNIMDLPGDPPPTIMEITREMASTRQNVTKMLEAMEREGLVTLEENQADRRSRRVRITESGYSCARQTAQGAQGFLKRIFGGIDEAEMKTAGKVLLQMLRNLSEMQDESAKDEKII